MTQETLPYDITPVQPKNTDVQRQIARMTKEEVDRWKNEFRLLKMPMPEFKGPRAEEEEQLYWEAIRAQDYAHSAFYD